MKKLGLNEIRELFQSFYEKKGHLRQESFPLIPQDDKSLLLINSGMAPLKPFFSGAKKPPATKMTTCQKCIRTGDIENVGITSRHGTFFEMLGSFSFGDYFKVESITWGYEFITEILDMPIDKVWVSVYEEDQEAYDIWKNKIGFPEERIIKLGKDDNFWEIGIGPCGPCSELYFDRGEEYGCHKDDCKPGCDCDRFVEFWNHVFTQFSKDDQGNYTPLAKPNIDTGLGLERLACIMQDVDSIFEIDTIKLIFDRVLSYLKLKEEELTPENKISVRIITDHIRSIVFMISDNILPGNEGRGYVLRKLIRRACIHGRKLNIQGVFLSEIAKTVLLVSQDAYPDLSKMEDKIIATIVDEEFKFQKTIDAGSMMIEDFIADMKSKNQKILSGKDAFKLYDTYGFPLDLTNEILAENGFSINEEEFNKEIENQREMARNARKKSKFGWDHLNTLDTNINTKFIGYTADRDASKVVFYEENDELGFIVLEKTPFYAEGGGQIADKGTITINNNKYEVIDVQKSKNAIVHYIKIDESTNIKIGDNAEANVDKLYRNKIRRNHTATHLLHRALKKVLDNDNINQAGSKVTADNLYFDFTYNKKITNNELSMIEKEVNDIILQFIDVDSEFMSYDESQKQGAIGLFNDKYNENVRVLSIGEYSKELCGGLHVSNSGQIGAFKIISEGSVSSGTRRIEAITGSEIFKHLKENDEYFQNIGDKFKIDEKQVKSKILSLLKEGNEAKTEVSQLKKQFAKKSFSEDEFQNINGIKLLTKTFENQEMEFLREYIDDLNKNNSDIIVLLANIVDNKVSYLLSVNDSLTQKGVKAGNLFKEISSAGDAKGGGKANMAQGGSQNIDLINNMFEAIKFCINKGV